MENFDNNVGGGNTELKNIYSEEDNQYPEKDELKDENKKTEGEEPLLSVGEELNKEEDMIKKVEYNVDTKIIASSYKKEENELVIERPYYESNKKPEITEKKRTNNCCTKTLECLKGSDEYDEIILSLSILLAQFIIILILSWLGFKYDINDSFIKSKLSRNLTFYITSLVILIMFFTSLGFDDDDFLIVYIVYLILYIPCIIFYCFLLSKYTKDIHILCGLVLYIFDILSFIVSFKFFNPFSVLIVSPVISTIILFVFHYLWIKNGLKTFKISTVGLSEIIYLLIAITISMKLAKNYVRGAVILNLAIFTPLALYVIGQCCG